MPGKKGAAKGADKGKPEPPVPEVKKEPELPDGKRTYVVGGWSSIKEINTATARADTALGDQVAIKPGVFIETVELEKDGLNIKGVGNNNDIIIAQGVKSTAPTCSLSGVTVRGDVEIHKGNPTVSDCIIEKGKHGVIIHAVCNPTIKNNHIREQTVAGVYCFPNSRGTVESNTIVGTGDAGTVGVFADHSNVAIKKNGISKQVTGITVQGECAGLSIQANSVQDIGGTGIHFAKGAKPACKGNSVQSCKYYGLLLEQEAAPVLEKNTVSACTVAIRAGCKPLLKHNQFTGRLEDENEVENSKLEPVY